MGEAKHDGLAVPGRVVLAHEQPFRMGTLKVDPATRQVECGGKNETLEPRVMQVLVALYQAGRIVTRDELIERCWAGRVVGDDAINRVISRLRHLAAEFAGGSFSVETIARVGYRLNIAAGEAPHDPEPVPAGTPASGTRRAWLGGVIALSAAGLIGVPLAWRQLAPAGRPPPEALALFERARALRTSGIPGNNRQEIAYLREAVRIAPAYGEAWGALAYEYRIALLNDSPQSVAGFEERLAEAVRQANRFSPGNADAEFARRLQELMFGRWLELEPVYRGLARRFPDHPAGHHMLGSLLMDVGRWDEAVVELGKAKARNPLAPMPRYKLVIALWSAGRISEAEQEIDEALRWSTHGAIWQTKVKLLAMTGRPQAALGIINDPAAWPDSSSEDYLQRWRQVLAAMISRSPADIAAALASLVEDARLTETAPVPTAFLCAILGDGETALDILEGSYLGTGEWASKHPADPSTLVTHPLFQPQARSLWGEARFGRILDGVGLERYWRTSGSVPDYRRA